MGRDTAHRPTLRTVAAAAGVSVATASNAYNRPERMSPEVRARVLAVARELGYAGPDPVGRTLRVRHSGTIGVLFSTPLSYAFDDPYCVALLAGVADIAEQVSSGLALMPLVPKTSGLNSAAMHQAVAAVQRAVIDGVLADGIDLDHPALHLLAARGVAVVTSVDNPDGRCVVIDEVGAARALGQHLATQGHARVAVLVDSATVPASLAEERELLFPYAALRLAGLRSAFPRDADVKAVAAGGNSVAAGRQATVRLLAQPNPPTAIAAVSDALALGALDGLEKHGLRPGRDLAVTGFDDIRASEQAGLTTVRQPIREKGRLMARMLLDPEFTARRVELPTELVIRASSTRSD